MSYLKRKNKTSSFSITTSPVQHASQRRRSNGKRTLLGFLRSLCCMVRQDGEQEPCRQPEAMYEVNMQDSYWKTSGSKSPSEPQSQSSQEHVHIGLQLENECEASSNHFRHVKEEGLDLVACSSTMPVLGQGSAISSLSVRSFSYSLFAVKQLLHNERNLIVIKEAKALRTLGNCIALRQLIGLVSHNCSLSVKFVNDRKSLATISRSDALTTINPREVSVALPVDNYSDMVELQPVKSAIAVKCTSMSAVDKDLSVSSFLCSGLKEQDLEPVTTGDTQVLGKGTTSMVTLRKVRSSKDSVVAVKRLHPGQPKSTLIKEAKILRKLDHCQVFPQLMGFIDHNDSPSLILEFVGDWVTQTSVSIFDALSTLLYNPRMLTSEWIGVAGDIAGGLSMLHRAGFVHGDLHNNNVLLYRYPQPQNPSGRSWQAKIIDLGSAEYIYTPSPLLQLSMLELSDQERDIYRKRTPYKAPELVEGTTGNTTAADTYAYGYLINDIGYFCNIDILMSLGTRCMDKVPSRRKRLAVVSRELSYFVRRYQNKEKQGWGY